MTNITDDQKVLGRSCRHHDPRGGIVYGKDCRIGHPIRKIVCAANGNSNSGIAYMMPCRPGPLRKANCPSYDPETDAEIAEEDRRMSKKMDLFVKALPFFNAVRSTMIEGKIASKIEDCPFCNAPQKMHVSCAIGFNNHLWATCDDCGEGFME